MLTGWALFLWHDASIVDQNITGLQAIAPDIIVVGDVGLGSTSDTFSTSAHLSWADQ